MAPLLRIAAPIALIAALLLPATSSRAQDLHPSRRPSPVGIASTFLGDTYVKVTYGRPYIRNRQIFGENTDSAEFLVPYGQLWRTGANEATEITITGPVTVAGERLGAGTYAIYATPRADEWTIHFSPHLGLDGTGRFDPSSNSFEVVYQPGDDVLAVNVPSQQIGGEPVDQFTISFEPAGDGAANLVLAWERTSVRVPLRAAN
ncbi:MAG TPA: DUF2911 domain-containing protein [Rhodothermales bacterium]